MCPCGSQKSMEECCGPYLNGTAVPETAEQLMRSRYTAFTVGDIKYIRQTTGGEALKDFKDAEALEWSKAKWRGLKVLSTKKGTASDREGVVEFTATYEQGGKVLEHHEVSKFRRDPKGQWVFVDGDAHVHEGGGGHHHHHHAPIAPVVRESPKVGRNDPCPCGSGQKYKKCCGAAA